MVMPGPPHPTQKFLKDETDPTKLYIIGKENYRSDRFIIDIEKTFWFCNLMNNFRKIVKI